VISVFLFMVETVAFSSSSTTVAMTTNTSSRMRSVRLEDSQLSSAAMTGNTDPTPAQLYHDKCHLIPFYCSNIMNSCIRVFVCLNNLISI